MKYDVSEFTEIIEDMSGRFVIVRISDDVVPPARCFIFDKNNCSTAIIRGDGLAEEVMRRMLMRGACIIGVEEFRDISKAKFPDAYR